jgi:hypothetical protein
MLLNERTCEKDHWTRREERAKGEEAEVRDFGSGPIEPAI